MRSWIPMVALCAWGCVADKGGVDSAVGVVTGGPGSGVPAGTTTGGTTPEGLCAAQGPGAVHRGVLYGAVQAAVDVSETVPDTVFVCPGTYVEALRWNFDAVVEGVGGAAEVTLQGAVDSPVIEVGGGSTTLRGLRITGGDGQDGGGVAAAGAQALVVEDCIIEQNNAVNGGGISMGPRPLTLLRTTVQGNIATGLGGGLQAFGSDVLIEESALLGNQADRGGGVNVELGSVTGVGLALLEGNQADRGAGLYLADLTVSGLVITGNTGLLEGGGVLIYQGGVLEESEVSANVAPSGGGISTTLGSVTMNAVTVDGNSASISDGGGLLLLGTALVATDLLVSNNTAAARGGGGWMLDGDWTGGVVSANTAADGGGVYSQRYGIGGVLRDIEVSGNTALSWGGGVFGDTSALSLDGVRVAGNTALLGGGIYLMGDTENQAQNTDVDGNSAPGGAGVVIDGGARLAMVGGSIVLNGDNTTVDGGGARITLGLLETTGVDFGDGLTDNQPDDVSCPASGLSYTGYGLATTLVCSELGCSPLP